MKILVVAAHDAVNLSIENIVRELVKRGHEVHIFAKMIEYRHIRMFKDLQVFIHHVSELNENNVSEYDFAFCPMDGVDSLTFYNIYVFSYNFIFNNRWASAGGDFMFTQTENRPIIQWEDCARMPVGTPKNDTLKSDNKSDNTILFVDTGHYPFGLKGKQQLAQTLLAICESCSNNHIVVKPRWLPGEKNTIHPEGVHLYDIISDLCNGEIPSNLELLYEHQDMQKLIDKSITVVTPASSAYLDAALRGKNILILNGFDSESSYDVRIDTIWKQQFDDMENTGCLINYADAVQYLPNGLKCGEEHLDKVTACRENVSAHVVDVMEYIFTTFIEKNKFPKIERYDLMTYQKLMGVDNDIDFEVLKQKRIKNQVLALSRRFDWVVANINYQPWLDLLNEYYINYPLTVDGKRTLQTQMEQILYEIWVEERDKLSQDSIDQSLYFYALDKLGRTDEILEIPEEHIFCKGSYYYYLGLIYKDKKQIARATDYFVKFLKEANTRSYLKYPQDRWGICDAYNYIFDIYNGENISASEFANLYIALYEQRDAMIIAYSVRKQAHSWLPKVAEQLADSDPELTLKCFQLYRKWRYHFKIGYTIDWFLRKLKNGVCSLQKYGWKYTVHRGIEKIRKYIGKKGWLKKGGFRLLGEFHNKILKGYAVYSKFIKEYGDNALLQLFPNSNGDVYTVLQYYEQYTKEYFADYINVAISSCNGYESLANWFSINNTSTISNEQWHNLIRCYIFVNNVHINILHHHLFIRHTGMLAYLEGIHGLKCLEMLETVFFQGITAKSPALLSTDEGIAKIFSDKGLQIGKTVLLSPYAQSLRPIPDIYWINLAKMLRDLGFSVCTDAFGSLSPIIGTIKIEIPFYEMNHFLNFAGYMVSRRSGIDDITKNALCKRVEVFAKQNLVRSQLIDIVENFAYSPDPIIVGYDNIDECVAATLAQLGLI